MQSEPKVVNANICPAEKRMKLNSCCLFVVAILVSLPSPTYGQKNSCPPRVKGFEYQPLMLENPITERYLARNFSNASPKLYLTSEVEADHSGKPVGLRDPLKIFTIEEMDGEPVLHISGQVYAGLTSLESFKDYHLSLEYKWGKKKYPPRMERNETAAC